MEVNALHRKFKRKIQLLKTKKKIEPQRTLGARSFERIGCREKTPAYDSFKEALFGGGAFAD
jgi:hypothetical protein